MSYHIINYDYCVNDLTLTPASNTYPLLLCQNSKHFASSFPTIYPLSFFCTSGKKAMNLSINGHSQVPPGFRFHPTEEELLHYYLRKKLAGEKIDLDVIQDVDLNKLEPWDIQEKCKIGSTPQNDWYFFSHKDKKYPTGTRTNRATAAGFWKATGRDKIIYSGFKRIGLRKTLVFYKGRAPHGQKSDWIMHEYRLDETHQDNDTVSSSLLEVVSEEGWVVCRVFRKKNHQKSHESSKNSPTSANSGASALGSGHNNEVLDQILSYMGRTCKLENEHFREVNRISFDINNNNNDRFTHLPRLESPTLSSFPINDGTPFYQEDHCYKSCFQSFDEMIAQTELSPTNLQTIGRAVSFPSDWATLDRLVASQLNCLEETSATQLSCLGDPDPDPDPALASFSSTSHDCVQISQLRSSRSFAYSSSENDLWGFSYKPSSPSSSDPLCHLSV